MSEDNKRHRSCRRCWDRTLPESERRRHCRRCAGWWVWPALGVLCLVAIVVVLVVFLAPRSSAPVLHLVFITQPADALANAAISNPPGVRVEVRDSNDNPVGTLPVITITINTGSGTLSGLAVKPANGSGIATFDNLTIDTAGSKTFIATSPGITSIVSNSFTIT